MNTSIEINKSLFLRPASCEPEYLSLRKDNEFGDNGVSDISAHQIESFPQKEREEISEKIGYSVILEILSAAKTVRQKLERAKAISFDEFRILMRLQRAEQEGGSQKRGKGC
jgi:hypothetical protein